MNLESELRSALKRREAPPGFAGRVLARTARPAPGRRLLRITAWAAAASLVAASGLEYRNYRQGVQAKEQVMLALRIAGSELNAVQQKLEQRNRPRALPAAGREEQ